MDIILVRKFREELRKFERLIEIQNSDSCCCGVTITQCHALMELSGLQRITQNELSINLGLDKSTVSRTIESLVRAELVSREIPAENRRITVITLTEMGKSVCKQINESNDQYFELILSTVPGKDLPVFLKSFNLVVNAMLEDEMNNS